MDGYTTARNLAHQTLETLRLEILQKKTFGNFFINMSQISFKNSKIFVIKKLIQVDADVTDKIMLLIKTLLIAKSLNKWLTLKKQ